MNQDYKNIHLIAIDDASTDETPVLLKQLESTQTKQMTILQCSAHNQARALNIGLAKVVEDFVALLDVDDLWAPDKISRQIEASLQKVHSGLIVTDFAVGDDPAKPWVSAWNSMGYEYVSDGMVFENLLMENFVLRSSALIPTRIIRGLQGFDEEISGTDDRDLWLRIAEKYPIFCVRKVCCFKRAHKGAMSLSERSRFSRIKMWNKWIRDLKKQKSKYIPIAKNNLNIFVFSYAYALYLNRKSFLKASYYFFLCLRRGYRPLRASALAVISFLKWLEAISKASIRAKGTCRGVAERRRPKAGQGGQPQEYT